MMNLLHWFFEKLMMNRFDRITAILIQLQSKRKVKAQEIADRFGISLRTVYRDIRSLEAAGVPILSEPGVGYSMMEGYRLPPVSFSKEEALTFITAEKLMDRFTTDHHNEAYQSALYKIKAVLRSEDKMILEDLEDRIAVMPNRFLPEPGALPLQEILQAIIRRTVLSISYYANHNQQTTKREIEPVGVFQSGEYWYLIAFCRLRNDYRTFRLDRLYNLQHTRDQFSTQHPPLDKFLQRVQRENDLTEVVIRIDACEYRYMGDQKYYHGFIKEIERNDDIEMYFLTYSLEAMARWILRYGDVVTILKPAALKDRIITIAEQILERIQNK